MSDLRTNSYYMGLFITHLREREGTIDHFYKDHNNLVTIGVGILIDSHRELKEEEVQNMLRIWINRFRITFRYRHNGRVANLDNVTEDWLRVKQGHRAQLKISDVDIDSLLSTRIGQFLDSLYEQKPFMKDMPFYVQMAVIDARFNPAKVAIYREERGKNFHPLIPKFWDALENGFYEEAEQHFIEIWKNRATPRYRQRHRVRVYWLKQGLFWKAGNYGPVAYPTY